MTLRAMKQIYLLVLSELKWGQTTHRGRPGSLVDAGPLSVGKCNGWQMANASTPHLLLDLESG